MIQFNLLPDIKLEYMKAQRAKRTVIAVSSLVTAGALVIVTFLVLSVFVFQRKHMNDLSKDIAGYTKNLNDTSNVNKILTVQSQLNSLTSLHDQKQNTNQIFPYIQELTPTDVSISSLAIDFDQQTMTITGAADSPDATNKLASVNKFIDTLKFTNYNDGDKTDKAFSDVVLSSFGRADKGASYSIDLKFDPIIFSNTEKVTLTVPNLVTTRSTIEKPNALFEPVTGADTSTNTGSSAGGTR